MKSPLGTKDALLPAMYSCTPKRPPAGGCGEAKRRIARWSNLPFLRHFVPSKGLTTKHRHSDRSPGTPRRTVFFHPFSAKEGNAIHMACRQQEQIQRQDRDMERQGTSHFLPPVVK